MNINNYTPKHININEARANAIKYEGTFEELKGLYAAGKITLVTNDAGDITTFWVDSGAENPLMDNLAGANFMSAYCCKPTMHWLDLILKGEEPAAKKAPEAEASEDAESELPSSVTISYDDLSGGEYADDYEVKAYLRGEYGHCFKKGTISEIIIDRNDDEITVSNISWGRALTEDEREGWKSQY